MVDLLRLSSCAQTTRGQIGKLLTDDLQQRNVSSIMLSHDHIHKQHFYVSFSHCVFENILRV